MADIIRAVAEAWERIGGMAVLTLTIIVAAGYVVIWNRKLIDKLAVMQETTIKENTEAQHQNTGGMAVLSSSVNKLCAAFGSDPTKVCQIMSSLREAGFDERTVMRMAKHYIKKNADEMKESS